MRAMLYFLPLFKAQAGRLALALCLSLLALGAGAALFGTAGWFITATAVSLAGVSFNIFGPSALVRGFSFLRILARYGERVTGHNATLKLLSDLRSWLFGRLFPRLPLTRWDLRKGDLVSRLTGDVDALDTVFLVSFSPMLAALVVGAVVGAIVWAFIPVAGALYLVAMAVATLGVPAGFLVLSGRAAHEVASGTATARMVVLDAIEGHRDLVACGETGWAREEFARAATRLAGAKRRIGAIGAFASGTVEALAALSALGVLWFGLEAMRAGGLGGPMLVALLLAVMGSFEAPGVLVRSIGKLGVASAAAERLQALATRPPPIADPVNPSELGAADTIVFDLVRFGHSRQRAVLNELCLTIEAGQRVAIKGASGAGKSTLVSLLLRLADPQAGTISVGGVDIGTVRQAEVHRRIALLAQDTPVFMDTVRNNLAIGRLAATDAELWRALDAARLGGFIRGTKGGLDGFLGEGGRTLSAGQARRLSLARVLVSHASIVVLDEPTSGLDPETERAFLADLAGAIEGKTTLIVTHATLPEGAVDKTYYLENGRLGETAPHDL